MATHTGPELIPVSAEARRVMRDLRIQLELSRATLEQRAKVGTDYIKRLELGRHPRVDALRLRRVMQVLHQAVTRGKVSAQLRAHLARVEKAVGQAGKSAAARGS